MVFIVNKSGGKIMPRPKAITDEEDFPIKPSDINTSGPLWGAFGNSETETSARYILNLMQASGDWREFTYKELSDIHDKAGNGPSYHFNHLIGEFKVVRSTDSYLDSLDVIVCTKKVDESAYGDNDDDTYRVTDEFVTRCFLSARIPRLKAPVAESVAG
jgi:hypothetical protein